MSAPAGPSSSPEPRYLRDLEAGYLRTFEAEVVALPPGAAVLSETLFYPTGGGQPCDQGTLLPPDGERVPVVDVGRQGGLTLHRLGRKSGSTLQRGMRVRGEIDWPRRYTHMRLHTAQHLLSARIFSRFTLRTRKAELSGRGATLDLDGPLEAAALPALSADLEEAVARPRDVRVRFVPRAEWDRNPMSERSGLVPLPRQVDPVRIVEIDATDACPCGGTHVRSTGELGPIVLHPPVPIAGGASRVSFSLEDGARPTPPA